ncbi:unnamed protein product [Leuciscus chuanchicus]
MQDVYITDPEILKPTGDTEDNTATALDKQVPKKPNKRPLEEVYGHNEVSESDAGVDVESSEKAGCSSALVTNDDVEEAKENEFVSQTVIAEKCSVDDTDGLSQYTDDSMRNDGHWSEGAGCYESREHSARLLG